MIGFVPENQEINPIAKISSKFPSLQNKIEKFEKGGFELKPSYSPDKDHFLVAVEKYLTLYSDKPSPEVGNSSTFIKKVFADVGIELPASSQEIARYGKVISENYKIEPGDLVFFANTDTSERLISHAGIYMGDQTFIHANSSAGISTSSLNEDFWRKRLLFATRW